MTPQRQGHWLLKRATLGFAIAVGLMGADFEWNLPKGFPRPTVPLDNPMSAAKVELGRYLFYDKRMSVNGKESCGSCHRQELAFTDSRARAEGTTGQVHPRGSKRSQKQAMFKRSETSLKRLPHLNAQLSP